MQEDVFIIYSKEKESDCMVFIIWAYDAHIVMIFTSNRQCQIGLHSCMCNGDRCGVGVLARKGWLYKVDIKIIYLNFFCCRT